MLTDKLTLTSYIASLKDRRYIDKPFWVLYFILIGVAVIALFSAGSTLAYAPGKSLLGPIFKQITFIALGVVCAYLMQFVPSQHIQKGCYWILGLTIICLYSMLIPGNPLVVSIHGAGRWINIFGIQFQPSEIAKLSLIVVVAHRLAQINDDKESIKREFWFTFALTAITCFPIITGNMSTAVLLAGIVYLMWFLARLPWKYLGYTALGAILVAVLFYFTIELFFINTDRTLPRIFQRAVTQVGRIDDMITDMKQTTTEFKVTDDNYQRSIARAAVMRGGKTPFGVLPGNSQERDFLPLAYADYIFAIIVEETGIVGAILLIFIYLAILVRGCLVSSKYNDYAAMLMVMGLVMMITLQAGISMTVAVGVGPVTGQPLPMISKGGTSALITSLYFGIILSVAREQNQLREALHNSVIESEKEVPTIILEEKI